MFAAVGLLAGCQSTASLPPGPTPEQTARGEAKAVIAALKQFRHDHGRYPADFAALVPQYLPAELKLDSNQYILEQAGTCLAYDRKSADAYELTFGLGLPTLQHFLLYRYSSSTGRWTSSEQITFVTAISRPFRE